jgi:hypothetical protein
MAPMSAVVCPSWRACLSAIPGMPIAEQRRAGVLIGRDYPAPVDDHAERRARALALYSERRLAIKSDDQTTET